MAYKFEIDGQGLKITDTISSDVFLVPAKETWYDASAMADGNVKLVGINYAVTDSNKQHVLFAEPGVALGNVLDENDTPFTEAGFLSFVASNLGKSSADSGGGGGDVTSVFGRTGAVVGQSSDYDGIYVQFNDVLPVFIQAKNNTGATLVKGKAVHITSVVSPSGKPEIELADSSSASNMPAVGLVYDDILDQGEGQVIVSGIIENLDTSAWNAGQVLYVNGSGDFSITKPQGTGLIQNIGIVARSHASSGSISVQGSSRTNDLPNLPENHYWVGDANGVPQAVAQSESGGWSFTEINSTPYAVADWDTVFGVHNDAANMEITLPDIGAGDVGKELKFWIEHNPANYKVIFKAFDTDLFINGVGSDGAEVAKGEIKSSYPSYLRVSVRAVESNQYYIEAMDSVYNQLRYVVSFDATSGSGPFSYLQFSAIPAGWNWRTQDWFAYMKIEKPMTNDSNGEVMFGSNNFFIAYRGNGTYFMTSGTSGYLQGLSPNTIVEAGEYLLYQYDSSADTFSAWVNGVKVLNATTSGITPPSTAPTEMWIGSEEGQAAAPSGYGYPLQQCKVSVMGLGVGNLSDADAALFTSAQYDPQANLTFDGGGTISNQWRGNATQMATDHGTVNLTAVGSDISFEQL